jgi:hypothetical protein
VGKRGRERERERERKRERFSNLAHIKENAGGGWRDGKKAQ